MDNKNFFNISRREFITKALKFSAGAAIFSMLPSTVSATTLSEWKEGKRFNFDDAKIKINGDIRKGDEDEIGIPVVGVEGITIHEPNLNFTQSLNLRAKTDGIVIHHVGNTKKNVNSATIHRWHIGNGWAGIGYHYIIRKDGTIERGRPLHAVGAHCYNQNEHTVGICVVGNFELERPTNEQFRAAESLVSAVCNVYNLHPTEKNVVGHKFYNKTDCPGIYLNQWLPDIIRNAKIKMSNV